MLSIPHISRKYNAALAATNSYSTVHYNPDINSLPMDSSYLSDSPSPANSTGQEYHSNNRYHTSPTIGHRRMSEPASLSGAALYATVEQPTHPRYTHFNHSNNFAYHQTQRLYPSHLHRGSSTGSLRDLRHHHAHFTPPSEHSEWKQEESLDARHRLFDNRGDGFDEPISPLQPNFSGGLASPTSAMPYSPINENPYGPSPPGTGTSTSSSVAPLSAGSGMPCSPSISIAQHLQRSMSSPNISAEAAVDRKTYSFVALPGNAVKKRPRRRYDEIERLYQCSWPDCTKAYGTLNHLNAHVTMQKHGSKRTPEEFKEMRKQWRKAKKEQAAATVAMRRDSYGDAYDDYGHHYLGHHSLHHIPRVHSLHEGLGLPSSVTIGTGERYSVPIEDIRYPPSNEGDDSAGLGGGYDNMMSRNRYHSALPSSWHGSSALSRPNLTHHQHQDSYGASSAPQHHTHHSQLPHLTIGANIPRPQSPPPHSAPPHPHNHHPVPNRGLPHHGGLLTTPLSGYQPDTTPSMIPSIQNASGAPNLIYTSEGYELYDSDSTGRPGTGHTNVSVS